MKVNVKLVGFPASNRLPNGPEPVAQQQETPRELEVGEHATVSDLSDQLGVVPEKALINGEEAGVSAGLKDGDFVVLFGPSAGRL